jgi:hypothetical protein
MGRAVADSLQKLTEKQLRATLMVAEDEKTDEAIAAEVGISRVTLHQWKKKPEFAAEVDAHVEAFKDRALSEGFADKRARIAALNGSAQDILRWLAENEYEREEVKVAANGEHVSFKIFDQARYAQFRGALDDIAKEMGDRKTVTELTGKDGEALVLGLVGVDIGKV